MLATPKPARPMAPSVILLHGWPYDIHSFVDVAPLAGVGGLPRDRSVSARLRHDALPVERDTRATASQSALAVDIIALMDALKIEKAILAGFDWGARTANIVAALWPERCKALVSVSGYLIGSQEAGKMPLPPKAELQWWYQYYFATERGRAGYEQIPARFREADLADRFAEMALRRCHVRSQRSSPSTIRIMSTS